jgi:hypothetical protein
MRHAMLSIQWHTVRGYIPHLVPRAFDNVIEYDNVAENLPLVE